MQGSLPESLILPSRVPQAVQAFRRRFVSPSTNVSAAGPDDYVNIYPDTSTPGAFIDTKSTYFMMDFEIQNNNFMVDFANWGLGGVGGAIIQDFKVNNQGSLLEDISEYGTVQEAYNLMEGDIQQETHMYFSNRLKNGYVGSCHKNFIKPPMCDGAGNIMFALNPYGLGFDAGITEAPTLYSSTAAGGVTMNQALVSQAGIINLSGAINLPQVELPFTHPRNLVCNPSWSTALGGVNFGGVNTAPSNMAPSPCDWPDFYSSSQSEIVRRNYVREYGSINKPQIMANLCNVKCFPIGMIPTDDCYSSGGTYGAVTPNLYTAGSAVSPAGTKQPAARSNKIRICYQPLSGIIGKLAPKMLATTLLAPQQLYFTLHFANAAIALNLSSDPCRRISNTIRDYVRNVGTQNSQLWGDSTYTNDDPSTPYACQTTDFAAGYNLSHSIPISSVGAASLNSVFNEAAATGRMLYAASLQPAAATPQYALTKTPWKYKALTTAGVTTINYAVDTEVFYGTYLKSSVPQSKRIFQFSDTAGANTVQRQTGSGAYPNNNTLVTYRVSNIALVGDQVILPDNITDLVVRDAAQGNFSVMTNSVRTYQMPVLQSEQQSIIIPAKVAMARQLSLIFQNLDQRSASLGYYYNSNCGYNPYASIVGSSTINASIVGFTSEQQLENTTLYGVGMRDPLVYTPTTTQSGGKSFQLVIGSDNFPPAPLTTLQEMSVEMVKTMKGWVDSRYSPDFDASISQALGTSGQYNSGSIGGDVPVYDCITGGSYATAFINANLLDDQTILANYDMVPLYGKNGNAVPAADVLATTFNNGYNYLCPRGHCVNGVFTVPEGRFMLSTNLSRFTDGDTTSGMYLGNNVITAKLSGAVGLSSGSWRCIALIPHEAQLTYMAGGQMLWNY